MNISLYYNDKIIALGCVSLLLFCYKCFNTDYKFYICLVIYDSLMIALLMVFMTGIYLTTLSR